MSTKNKSNKHHSIKNPICSQHLAFLQRIYPNLKTPIIAAPKIIVHNIAFLQRIYPTNPSPKNPVPQPYRKPRPIRQTNYSNQLNYRMNHNLTNETREQLTLQAKQVQIPAPPWQAAQQGHLD